jgi:hypothetical protein
MNTAIQMRFKKIGYKPKHNTAKRIRFAEPPKKRQGKIPWRSMFLYQSVSSPTDTFGHFFKTLFAILIS